MVIYAPLLPDFIKHYDKCTQVYAYKRVLFLPFKILWIVSILLETSPPPSSTIPYCLSFWLLVAFYDVIHILVYPRLGFHVPWMFVVAFYRFPSCRVNQKLFCDSILFLLFRLRINTKFQSVTIIKPTLTTLASHQCSATLFTTCSLPHRKIGFSTSVALLRPRFPPRKYIRHLIGAPLTI